MKTKIFVHDIVVEATHGVSPEEKKRAQLFSVDIEVEVEPSSNPLPDTIESTVNYAHLRKIVQEVLGRPPHNLIETLGALILERVFEDERVLSAEVTIRKRSLWASGIPGVRISRVKERPDNFIWPG